MGRKKVLPHFRPFFFLIFVKGFSFNTWKTSPPRIKSENSEILASVKYMGKGTFPETPSARHEISVPKKVFGWPVSLKQTNCGVAVLKN